MKIDGLSLPNSGNEAATGSKAPKDEFLRLLVAQLEHQNPLNPQDGAEFIAQLAQLAQVEGTAETNQRLAALEVGQAAATRAGYTSMIGRTMTARLTELQAPAVEPGPAIMAKVEAPATKVEAVIKDSEGAVVRRIPLNATQGGELPIPWDGKLENGQPLAAGTYSIEVEATTSSGAIVPAYAVARGVVRAVELGENGIHFSLDGLDVTPGDILSIADSTLGGSERTNNNVNLELTHDRLERPWGLRTGYKLGG